MTSWRVNEADDSLIDSPSPFAFPLSPSYSRMRSIKYRILLWELEHTKCLESITQHEAGRAHAAHINHNTHNRITPQDQYTPLLLGQSSG